MNIKEAISRVWQGNIDAQRIELSQRNDEELEVHKIGSERLNDINGYIGLLTWSTSFALTFINGGEGRFELANVDAVLMFASMLACLRAKAQIDNRVGLINQIFSQRREAQARN